MTDPTGAIALPPPDEDFLTAFEGGLDPVRPERSAIPFTVIGYGEISTVFTIQNGGKAAYKRMPLFDSVEHAAAYVESFREYSGLLRDAGLRVPPQQTAIIAVPGRPVVLYLTQPLLPPGDFCHVRIRDADLKEARAMIRTVAEEIRRVWHWNEAHAPGLQLSLDGQLSNWVYGNAGRAPAAGDDGNAERATPRPRYVDTSTPMFRRGGVEQLDAELFLESAPGALRWVLRLLFVEDVLTRYYDLHQVMRDLVANLYKEGRPDLVAPAVDEINALLGEDLLTVRDVDKYYSGDKTIWRFYLAFRKMDRFLSARIFGRRYEFLLPGKIRR